MDPDRHRRRGRPSELTEGLEDAAAGLVDVLRLGPVGDALRQPLLPVLVAGLTAVAPAPAIALGHAHADVDGVVTCRERGGVLTQNRRMNS